MLYSDEIYIEDFKRTYADAYKKGFIDGFNERGYLLTYIGNDHIKNQNDHIKAEQTEPQTEEFQDWKDRMWAEAVVTEPQTDCDHRCVQTEVGCEQTDCPWK